VKWQTVLTNLLVAALTAFLTSLALRKTSISSRTGSEPTPTFEQKLLLRLIPDPQAPGFPVTESRDPNLDYDWGAMLETEAERLDAREQKAWLEAQEAKQREIDEAPVV
jgi:hypothetical protein